MSDIVKGSGVVMGKIAYIGHSYHEKTGSTVFFIELLKKNFDVEVIPNDSWTTGALPKVEHLDDSYEAVVLFQLVSEKLLRAIRTKNIVYVPMADYIINGIDNRDAGILSYRPYVFWEMLARRGVKILNFSENVHRLCVNLGMQSRYVQYYPTPVGNLDFGDEVSVFYWERVDSVSPQMVKALIGDSASSLHHHRAHDPGQCKDAEARERDPFAPMRVTTSSWFADKEDYLRHVAAKSVYIAPRCFEGIGMSFLEAMAMGKAVVALDYPTMNEYIRHERNGYLFDFRRPRPIDFGNIAAVRRNAYESVVRGHERWTAQSSGLVDWICQPCEERRQASFLNVYGELGISSADSPKMNVRTLVPPDLELHERNKDKSPDEAKGPGRIVRAVARITLGDLVSPSFWMKCIKKLLGPAKKAVIRVFEALNGAKCYKRKLSETVSQNVATPVSENVGAITEKNNPSKSQRSETGMGAGIRIVVSSNCQTAGIASALQFMLPSAHVEALPIISNLITDEHKPTFKKALSRTDYWVTITQPELLDEWNFYDVKAIRVPGIMFRAFHPDIVYARSKKTDQLISNSEHYNSLIVLWCWMNGFSVGETKSAFNEQLMHKLGYMDIWDASWELIKDAFSRTDIDFRRFFIQIKRMGLFMHSINHPIQPALSAIAQQVAEIICPRCGGNDPVICNTLNDPLRHSIWPLYPPIADSMSLYGSYSWRLADKHYPDLASFIEHSYSIYAAEGIHPEDVAFQFIPVDSQLKILESELGRAK
jgi:hypothetical protein